MKIAFKWFKRLLSAIFILLILLVSSWPFAVRYLKNNGITFTTLKFNYPLYIQITDLVIDLKEEGFYLELKDAKFDLHLKNLLQAKLTGESFNASGLKIRTYPSVGDSIQIESDTSKFSYSIIPFLEFNKIKVEGVDMAFYTQFDSTIIQSHTIRAYDFTFNDSISAYALIYEEGNLDIKVNTDPNEVNTSEPFHLTEYIPKYRTNNCIIKNLNFKVSNDGSGLYLKKINSITECANSTNGLSAKPKILNFTIQDTLQFKVNSDRFTLSSLVGGHIPSLKLNAPGIYLNLNNLKTLDGPYGELNQITITDANVTPTLLQLISGNKIFRNTADNIHFNGTLTYTNDTLSTSDSRIFINNSLTAQLNGYFAFLPEVTKIDYKIDNLKIDLKQLEKQIIYDVPEHIEDINLTQKAKITGTLKEPVFKLEGDMNHIPLKINGNIFLDHLNNSILNLQIKSAFAKFKESFPKLNQSICYNNLQLNTSINLNTFKDFQYFNASINADTIQYSDYKLIKSDFKIITDKRNFKIVAESNQQDWKLNLTTGDNPLTKNTINYTGEFEFKVNDLENAKIKTGNLLGYLNGKLIINNKELSCDMNFDSLKFTSATENNSYKLSPQIHFKKTTENYETQIIIDTVQFVKIKFNDSLFKYLSDLKLDKPLPDLLFEAKLNLDSSFVNTITGTNACVKINSLMFSSKNNQSILKMEAPKLSYNDLKIDSIYINYNKSELLYKSDLFIKDISYNSICLKNIENRITGKSKDSLHFFIAGNLKDSSQHLDLNALVNLNEESILFKLNPSSQIHIGSSVWDIQNNDGIAYNFKNKNTSGSIGIKQKEQNINLTTEPTGIKLITDSLKIGPLASSFFDISTIDAYLHSECNLNTKTNSFKLNGNLKDIYIDSIDVGIIDFNTEYSNAEIKYNVHLNSTIGEILMKGKSVNDKLSFNTEFKNIDLLRIDSIFKLSDSKIKMDGLINGNSSITIGKTPEINGTFNLDRIKFEYPEYGINAFINNQFLLIQNNIIVLNNFKLQDKENNELNITGKINLVNQDSINLKIKSENFSIVSNTTTAGYLKGNLKLKSDIVISGVPERILVTGNALIPKGGNIEYFHKGSVSLNSNENIIVFKELSTPEIEKNDNLKRNKFKIDYNVSVDIGTTNLYILLSKSHQEYIKINPSGYVKLSNGNNNLPNLFGTVESNDGKVYYEAPLIQNIDLNIEQAKLSWNGPYDNPMINFKGSEIFRVTPNEMSGDLKNKTEKVPVIVNTSITNKTVDKFELDFNISSTNGEVQNYLNSLPPESKETAAIDMMLFGKLNNDADKSKSTLTGVVNKMNEISRRNIKNADLTFHVDKYNINGSETETKDNLGYTFSKGLFHEKLKLSVGGNLGLNQTVQTEGPKSSLINNIQLKYIIKEKPEIFIQLCRESKYKGPFEGQIDESAIGIGFTQEHKNLFKRNVTKK